MQNEPELTPINQVAEMFSADDYMYFYQDFLTPEHSDEETAQVAAALEIKANMYQSPSLFRPLRVLDLACGFGRIANRLAKMGHRVTGVEYLPEFLEIAKKEAAEMGVLEKQPRKGWVEYQQGDMRQIEYDAEFDRAIMIFNSFGYFSDDENFNILQRIARALKPGGLLGFDIANRDGVLNDFHPHYVSEKDGNLMINRFSFDIVTGRLHNQRIVIRDGVRKDKPFSIRLYNVTEIRDLLAQVGLALEALYEEWDGSPLRMDSPSLVVVARKGE